MNRKLIYFSIQLLFITVLFLPLNANGQSNKVLKKQASDYWGAKNYPKALFKYKQLAGRKPNESKWQYLLAQCYLKLSDYENALKHLKAYLKDKKHEDQALLLTARALHLSENYKEAPHFYKLYLKVSKLEEAQRFAIKKELMQALAADRLSRKKAPAVVVTLGDSINSHHNELKALHHPNSPNRIFFSSDRNGNFDIYNCEMRKGNWQTPRLESERYNSPEDELLLAFPDEGFQVIYQRGLFGQDAESRIDNYNSSQYDSIALDVPFPLGPQQALSTGEHYFFSDSLVLYAATPTDQPEQTDLYYIQKDANGNWTAPQVLSPKINSLFNERSPFLAKDGRTLYFSSDRPNSMGGYDIYRSVFQDSLGSWTNPENLGVPINSAGDDLFFYLMEDGLKGYLSSERNKGKGGMDLYSLYFRQYRPEQLNRSNPKAFTQQVLVPNILALNKGTEDPNSILNRLSEADKDSSQANTDAVYKFSPIYYNGESGQLQSGGEKIIKELALLLNRYKEVKVLLTSHTDDINPLESNLFLSVQQAESIAQQLIEKGVNSDQIYLRGCAQQYPLAQNYNFDGSPNLTGRKLNQRIDIKIFNANHLPIKIEIKKPMVSSVMQSNAAEIYQKNTAGLSYKVQLLQTPTLFNHSIIKQLKNSHTEKRPQKAAITYTIGMAKQFKAITHILETAHNMGFDEAKIIPYVNGMEINLQEAQSLTGVYPDLEAYLNHVAQTQATED
jgi:outer membrane protein OmpA-like peptidoglycan-associated protein